MHPPRGGIISTGLLSETAHVGTRRVFPLFTRKTTLFCQITANLSHFWIHVYCLILPKSRILVIVFDSFFSFVKLQKALPPGKCLSSVSDSCHYSSLLLISSIKHPFQHPRRSLVCSFDRVRVNV